MAHVLTLQRVRIRLGERELVAVDTEVPPGAVLTIMGPSGSGKSTLLAFIAGFLEPSFKAEGRALLDGVDLGALPPERRHVGLLFQDPLLFPHLSVAGNVMFGLARSIHDRRRVAREALASAGLDGFDERDPATLSGGQQARVALLRVLLSGPRALLLDEPFSKLDQNLRAEFRRFVFDRVRTAALPTVLVTHDPADAADAGGEVVSLDGL
jgi:putative thiamine transport system ATP-binding protein